jgi:hypothetical protein
VCGAQIIVDTVVISNDERYSSQVENFMVLGAAQYPANEWMVLGDFVAANKFGEQSFPVTSKSWVRYIKLRCVRAGAQQRVLCGTCVALLTRLRCCVRCGAASGRTTARSFTAL